MKDKKRTLCIDYGEKRIGVAISDPLGLTAQGVCTLQSVGKKRDVAEIIKIIAEKGVGEIVMGLPLKLDGSHGTIYEKVKKFGRSLEAASSMEITYLDERYSSAEAEKVLLEADISRAKRKESIDMLAAQLILQKHLDAIKATRNKTE